MPDLLSSSSCHIWWHSFVAHDLETGKPKPFYVEFYLCNQSEGSPKPVFGQAKASKAAGLKPSYLMINAGSWGEDHSRIHRFHGCRKAEIDDGYPFAISAGESFLTEDATRGVVSVSPDEAASCKEKMTGSGYMSWSLVVDIGTRTRYKGEVNWNGRRYSVSPDSCFGYSDCLKAISLPFIRLFCSSLKSEKSNKKLRDSSFELRSCDGALLSSLEIAGRRFRFSGPFCHTVSECREATRTVIWHVEQRRLFSKVVFDVSCRKRDMLLMCHETPAGAKVSRHWSGGTGTGTVTLYRFGRQIDCLHADNIFCDYAK